jgi:hypothetical protein
MKGKERKLISVSIGSEESPWENEQSGRLRQS